MISAVVAALALGQSGYLGDTRLDKEIGIALGGASASDLCMELSHATGVPLQSSKAIEEDLLVLRVKSRPARDVMKTVARHFSWQWTPVGKGYRLEPSAAFRVEEKRSYEERVMSRFAPLRRQAQNYTAAFEEEERTGVQTVKWQYTPVEVAALRAGFGTLASLQPAHWQQLDSGYLVFSIAPERSRWPLPARAKAAIDQALKRLDATGSTDNGGGLGSLKSYSREKLHAVDVIVPASKDRFEVWYIGKGGEELGFFNANLAYTHEPPSLPTRLDLNKIPSPPTTAGLSPALQLPLLGNRYLTLLATDVDLISDLYEEYLEDRNWGRVTVEDGWAKVRAQHWGYWRSRTPSRAAVLPLLEQRGDRGFSLDQLARLAKRFRGQPESLLRFYDRVLGMQTSLTNPWLLLWADLSQEQRTSFKKDATVRLRELPASALEGVRAVLFSRRDAGDCGTIAVEDFLEKEPFASFGFITRGTPKPPSPQDLKEGYLRGRWAEVPGTNSASTHSTSLSSAENKELVIQEGALLEIVLPGGSGARGRLRSARRQ